MDISSITSLHSLSGLEEYSRYYNPSLNLFSEGNNTVTFDALYQSAIGMINETNELTNKVEEEEIKFAVGGSSIIDLQSAQNKASMSLQYTIAVRNAVVSAYKELMNLSF